MVCEHCERPIIPVRKKVSLLLALILFLLGFIPGIVYLIIATERDPIYCPICKNTYYKIEYEKKSPLKLLLAIIMFLLIIAIVIFLGYWLLNNLY